MTRRRLAVFGSTGSIGVSALSVVSRFPGAFDVAVLAARGRKPALLLKQARAFRPKYVVVTDPGAASIAASLPRGVKLLTGEAALVEVLSAARPDILLHGIVGAAGLPCALEAVRMGVDLAIANKESLVCAGGFLRAAAKRSGAALLPVDSEHSAIFQVLVGEQLDSVRRLVLTASGGPLFRSRKPFRRVTVREALAHPNWKMGPKITIDSATLMNKALEIIEARFLFDLPPEKIDVIIHPESTIHSMVEYIDGSVIMQAGVPDMRLPIQYALFYPRRRERVVRRLDLTAGRALTFHRPDMRRFRSLPMAYRALKDGGAAPAVLSAANEIAVAAFLEKKIRFDQIMDVVIGTYRAFARNAGFTAATLTDILDADRAARRKAEEKICSIQL